MIFIIILILSLVDTAYCCYKQDIGIWIFGIWEDLESS